MKPKYIGTIDAAGIPFKVYMVDQPKSDKSEAFGTTNRITHEIEIKRGMSKEFTFDTLLHEVQHAIWECSGLYELVVRAGVDKPFEFEELFIRVMTPHLVKALKSVERLKL